MSAQLSTAEMLKQSKFSEIEFPSPNITLIPSVTVQIDSVLNQINKEGLCFRL